MFLPDDFAKNFADVNEPFQRQRSSFHPVFGSTVFWALINSRKGTILRFIFVPFRTILLAKQFLFSY